MQIRPSRAFFAAMLLAAILVSACDTDDGREPELPSELRVGVLPDESPETLYARYEPLIEYLEGQLKTSCRLIVPDSYGALLEQFHERQVDVAYFGGYAFVRAHLKDGAVPLVMREVDKRFTSLFIVRKESDIRSLSDLKGKVFTFGSELSTSGHLMPRYFLQQDGIVPESYFADVHYSGTHDNTVLHVRDGIADAGVANAEIVRSMQRNGVVSDQQIRILYETPPYADYVWAVHPELGENVANAVQAAFLRLAPENEDHRRILRGLSSEGYLPADLKEFDRLEQIVREQDNPSTSDASR